jgi:O-antigen ligase like membrane protein
MAVKARRSRDGSLATERNAVRDLVLNLPPWILISAYLVVDMISGMLIKGNSAEAPLSEAWKGVLVVLILTWAAVSAPRIAIFLLVTLVLFLIGPLARLFTYGDAGAFAADATAGIKALLPLFVLCYCNELQRAHPSMLRKWARRALYVSSIVVLANVALGALGFGHATYQYGTQDSSVDNVGVKGFFYSGNEVGATLVIVCSYVLIEVWSRYRWLYSVAALLMIVAAFMVATKGAIVATLVLAVGIPVINGGFRPRRPSAKGVFVTAAVFLLFGWGVFRIWDALISSGLADKILVVLSRRGWIGVLLSGRNQFTAASVEAMVRSGTWLQVIVGFGRDALAFAAGKQSVEMDPFDLYFWFGIPGIVYGVLLYAIFLYLPVASLRRSPSDAARTVFLTNVLLIGISIVAGHVILSGMVGIVWAVLNAYMVPETREQTAVSCSEGSPRPLGR